MAKVIDPERHADLIGLQRAANEAFDALAAHAPDVRGLDLTDAQRAEAARLREEASEAALAVRAALFASTLPEEHDYYIASQALKDAARPEPATR
jgi:chemotaxis response regulator CheB